MKRLCLMFSASMVLAASVAGVAASGASAYDEEQARAASSMYATLHFHGFPYWWGCDASGKNKAGEAQWYCWGYFEEKSGEWKVNVGPYGEITYESE